MADAHHNRTPARNRVLASISSERIDRILTVIVVTTLALMGAGELAVRLDDPAPLLFWLPTLWGGAGLLWTGVFKRGRDRAGKALVIVGSLLAFLPSAWTIVMPVLLGVLVLRTLIRPSAAQAAA